MLGVIVFPGFQQDNPMTIFLQTSSLFNLVSEKVTAVVLVYMVHRLMLTGSLKLSKQIF